MGYPGGKGGAGIAQLIINQQPPHVHYIEPFLGGGAVMRAKRPAFRNTAIDLDPRPIAAFSPSAAASNFSTMVDDGVQWLIDHGRELRIDALVYCDPPYLMETRRSQRRIYREEFTDDDHWRLLRVLRELRCMVQLSGYWSKLYAKRLSDWRVIRFQNSTRRGPREECLWMNYPEPTALHDWRFLGDDFRERERIKRKTARWTARIAALPLLERTSLLSAMASSLAGRGEGISRAAVIGVSDERIPQPGRIGENGVAGSCRRHTLDLAMPRASSPGSAREAIIDRTAPETAVLQ
jgi:hypothetical protein